MRKADSLSRRLDLKEEAENSNKDQKLIKEEWIRGMIKVVVEGLEIMLVEKIKRAGGKDKVVVKVVKEMKKARAKVLREDKWELEEKLVLKEGKLYMPKDKKLRLEVFKLYYDILVARHKRRKLMINEVLEKVGTYLMVEFITKEGTSAEKLARLFRDNMWKLYRLLEGVISDRKP